MLRDIIATELESSQILDRNFESLSPSFNGNRLCTFQRSPLVDVTNMQTNRTIENPVKENEKEKCHVHATKSMLFNCTSETDQFRVKFEGYSSDSDFEKPKDKKVKDIPTAGKVMQDDGTQAQFQGDAVSCKQDSNKRTETLEWEHLHPALQALLPFENGLTYVITDFTLLPSEDFLGAPEHSYEATVRINIAEKESAQSWMQKMMQHSKCTYRHTRGRKTGLKRDFIKWKCTASIRGKNQHLDSCKSHQQQSQGMLVRCSPMTQEQRQNVPRRSTSLCLIQQRETR